MKFDLKGTVVVAGAGKMGGALLEGLLTRGFPAKRLMVQEPTPTDELRRVGRELEFPVVAQLGPLNEPPEVILVAVKPQAMESVFPPLARLAGPDTLTISIAAGRTIASYERHLPKHPAVVRAMPNTPAEVGRGITVCCANAHVTPAQRRLTEVLMSAVGEVGWIEDEALMDAVTAVSGSGPAYVFLLAECLEAAAKASGIDANLARRLACVTVSGAGELLRKRGDDAAKLRQNVTSPGGTTAAALDVLMADDGLESLMKKAVASAVRRGRELSK